jgi:pimeloyl-ACP methyl ester carboxylesterase
MIALTWLQRSGEGVPVVFIPGIDGSSGSVEPIAQRLAAARSVAIVDYGGENQASLEALADAIRTHLADELDRPFDLVGQSIGSILAARVAASEPRVRKLVLCAAFTRVRNVALKISSFISRHSPPWFYRFTTYPTLALACGPVGDGWRHPLFAGAAQSHPQGVARRTLWQVGQDFSATIAMPGQPVLVLMGARDRFVPDIGRETARLRQLLARANAHVESLPGAGHVFLPSAAVARAAGRIEEFLS